jgi:hypothetical protein
MRSISEAGRTNAGRGRPPTERVAERRRQIAKLIEAEQPCSVRNVYYRAVVAGIVPKTDNGYNIVQRDVVELRRSGMIPFPWIVDYSRLVRKPTVFDSIEAALANTARHYRRDLWSFSDVRIEVWTESQSIASVVASVTDEWALPLMATKGYSSWSFTWSAAQTANYDGRHLLVLYIGDHDPAGLEIESSLKESLEDHLRVPFVVRRVGVKWEHVQQYDLPGTTPKKTYGFPLAVEAEALPAPLLRELLSDEIGRYADPHHLQILKAAEESERAQMRAIRFGAA